MVSVPTCKKCKKRVYGTMTSEGLCYECNIQEQMEEEREEINNVSFPKGIIATWNSSPGYLDKKNNYMYFRIPSDQRLFFDPEITYQVIIKQI
jgi:hypothetical protein